MDTNRKENHKSQEIRRINSRKPRPPEANVIIEPSKSVLIRVRQYESRQDEKEIYGNMPMRYHGPHNSGPMFRYTGLAEKRIAVNENHEHREKKPDTGERLQLHGA